MMALSIPPILCLPFVAPAQLSMVIVNRVKCDCSALGSNTFLTDSWSLAPPHNGVPLSAIFSVNLGTEPLSAMSSPGPAVSRDVTHSSRVTCHEQRESCDDDGGGAEEGSFLQTVMQAGQGHAVW